jgi:hypothetical protein
MIATQLGIPVAMVKKRRELLEKQHLEYGYHMDMKGVGHRRLDFQIATHRGMTIPIAKSLLKMREIVSVGRSIGRSSVDLRSEIIIKDNEHLVDLIDRVRGLNGVEDVNWSEIVQVVGKKGSVPPEIIDAL